MKALEREVKDLRRCQPDLAQGVHDLCPSGARLPRNVMVHFVEDHRDVYGVESICAVIAMAPSTDDDAKVRRVDTARRPARAHRDAVFDPEIRLVWPANHGIYRATKVRKQLQREDIAVAHCAVPRHKNTAGIRGVVRGIATAP